MTEGFQSGRPLLLGLIGSLLIFLAIIWAIGACLSAPFTPSAVVLTQLVSALVMGVSFVGLLRMRRWSPRVFFVSWPIIVAIAMATAARGDRLVALSFGLVTLLLYFIAWSANRAKFI